MPEKIFRTEPAFFGVQRFTRFRVFHRSPYKNRKSSAWSAYHTGQIPERGSPMNTGCRIDFRPIFGHTPRKFPASLRQPLASSHIKLIYSTTLRRKLQ